MFYSSHSWEGRHGLRYIPLCIGQKAFIDTSNLGTMVIIRDTLAWVIELQGDNKTFHLPT